jgi:hypothetical protein
LEWQNGNSELSQTSKVCDSKVGLDFLIGQYLGPKNAFLNTSLFFGTPCMMFWWKK